MPALVTTQKGLNEPRFASMMGIMKAKKKPIEVKTPEDLGVDPAQGVLSRIVRYTLPPERAAGKIFKGSAAGCVEQLATALKQEAKVL